MKRVSPSFVWTSDLTTRSTPTPARRRRPLIVLAAAAWPVWAWASGTSGDLPWNNFLDKLQANITGPTATALIFIAIAGALVVWSMSDDHRGLIRFGKALGALATLAALGALLGVLGISGATV
jgi:type IV secretory pathway VirB2 component (pilin)